MNQKCVFGYQWTQTLFSVCIAVCHSFFLFALGPQVGALSCVNTFNYFLTIIGGLCIKGGTAHTLLIWCACKQFQIKSKSQNFNTIVIVLKSIVLQYSQQKSTVHVDRHRYSGQSIASALQWTVHTSRLTVWSFTYPISCWFITGNAVLLLCKWKRMRQWWVIIHSELYWSSHVSVALRVTQGLTERDSQSQDRAC